jgi:DNA polymerase-3 subunit alpha
MQRGENIAVFQMESGGMTNACRQLEPDRIEEVIALLALYRPGPMDLIPSFIKRKKGEEKVEYLHPLLEDVSKETYGILIYQEQVQKAANLLAGYTLGAADVLRRAMGKKKPEEMAKQREIFVKGCAETNGISEKKANDIFDLLEKFAGYGFNKSHSAAYGIITYRTAYLKAHYPVEFMAAVLSYEVNSTEKIALFVSECQRMGITILPPDLNRSALKFAPECIEGSTVPNAIRYGLSAVKNVGEGAMEGAIREREANGPFKSLEDFCQRVDARLINKRLMEALIKVGALDFTGEDRAAMFARIDSVLSNAAGRQKEKKAGVVSLFGDEELGAAKNPLATAAAPESWGKEQIMGFEKELLGFFVSGHPLDKYRHVFDNKHITSVADLHELKEERTTVRCAGTIQRLEIKFTKKDNRPFATFAIEDFTGTIEVIAWNETYEKCKDVIKDGAPVGIKARAEKDSRTEAIRLTAQEIKPLPLPEETDEGKAAAAKGAKRRVAKVKPISLRLDSVRHTEADLDAIRSIIQSHPGEVPVELHVRIPGGHEALLSAGEEFRVDANDRLRKGLGLWLA